MKPNPLHPVTPDGRYFVVRGRLWRCSNPALSPKERQGWVDALMHACRAVAQALKRNEPAPLAAARARVDIAKRALGERGPVWWTDGEPDWNRHSVHTTPYAAWYAALRGCANPASVPL